MDNQFRVDVKDAEILISEIFEKKVVLKKKQILFLKDYAFKPKGHDSHGLWEFLDIVIGLMKAKFFLINNIL